MKLDLFRILAEQLPKHSSLMKDPSGKPFQLAIPSQLKRKLIIGGVIVGVLFLGTLGVVGAGIFYVVGKAFSVANVSVATELGNQALNGVSEFSKGVVAPSCSERIRSMLSIDVWLNSPLGANFDALRSACLGQSAPVSTEAPNIVAA